MEEYRIQVNPQVKRVIQSFQTAAVRSLCGPNGMPIRSSGSAGTHRSPGRISSEEFHLNPHPHLPVSATTSKKHSASATHSDGGKNSSSDYDSSPFTAPPPFPQQQIPVFAPVDTTKSELSETILEGETIACFTVGGEKRLCLPQILNPVLREFSLQQINGVCDDLHIFCSRCNQVQLGTLKALNIIPASAPSCGLITKTDAERLCNALLHGNPERSMEPPSRNFFKVYHECFGKCKGIFNVDLYTSADAKCIRCVDCYGMFNPAKFVCHSHRSLENHTCHWGFDSANWRSYLLLAKDQNLDHGGVRLQDALEEVKSRFDPMHKQKRRQSPDWSSRNESTSSSKRTKSEISGNSPPTVLVPAQTSWEALSLRQLSSFYPWSPYLLSAIKEGKLLPPPAVMREGLAGILPSYLHTGPPVLLNPERVIPYSESERYERHFTPNVSLAPSSSQKSSLDEEEEEEEDLEDKPVALHRKSSGGRGNVSSGHKVSPIITKPEVPVDEVLDCDVSTDTDDSSLPSPADSSSNSGASDVPLYKSTLQQELCMIRSLLEGKVEAAPEAQAQFLKEYSRLRAKSEETVQWLICVYKTLRKELEASQKQNLELVQLLANTERELKLLTTQREQALRNVRTHKEQVETHKKFDLELENQHRSMETVYGKMCQDNSTLMKELATLASHSSSLGYTNGRSKSSHPSSKMVLDLTVSPDKEVVTVAEVKSGLKREQSITVD